MNVMSKILQRLHLDLTIPTERSRLTVPEDDRDQVSYFVFPSVTVPNFRDTPTSAISAG